MTSKPNMHRTWDGTNMGPNDSSEVKHISCSTQVPSKQTNMNTACELRLSCLQWPCRKANNPNDKVTSLTKIQSCPPWSTLYACEEQHQMAKLTWWKQVTGELLNSRHGDLRKMFMIHDQATKTQVHNILTRHARFCILRRKMYSKQTVLRSSESITPSSSFDIIWTFWTWKLQNVLRQPSHIKSWGNHTALIDAADELHDNLSCSVVINDLQVTNVAMLLHHLQEFDDDFGIWPDQDLTFSTLLRIHNVVQAIAQHTDSHHLRNWCPQRDGWLGVAWTLKFERKKRGLRDIPKSKASNSGRHEREWEPLHSRSTKSSLQDQGTENPFWRTCNALGNDIFIAGYTWEHCHCLVLVVSTDKPSKNLA